MDEDLEDFDVATLRTEARRLREGIRAHRDATGHALCWHHPDLWRLLPEPLPSRLAVPPWEDFMRGCVRYRQSLESELPDAPRVAQEPPAFPYEERGSTRFVRAVSWRRTEESGSDHCELWEDGTGHRLSGVALMLERGAPVVARYEVRCDAGWVTRRARVAVRRDGVERTLDLRVDGEQRWWRGGEELTTLRGCVDVDLVFSPATNTIPLQRLHAGGSTAGRHTIRAAWVQLEDLSVPVLEQTYVRLDPWRFRFESPGFQGEVTVDDLALVTRYAPGWERVAA